MDFEFPFPADMLVPALVAVLVGVIGMLAYMSLKPPPAKICGSVNGPPIESPRVRLSDGRHLAYREVGVPREEARHKIVVVHGFNSSKDMNLPIDRELIDELKLYVLYYDRAGYGESDPHSPRSVKDEAYDIQELADRLGIGPKFYVIGVSMGGYPAWSCLKYIPHRLSGVALVVPFVHYWWPKFPRSLMQGAFMKLPLLDQWTFRLGYHAPWLIYRWMTQKLFTPLSIMSGDMTMFSRKDLDVLNNKSFSTNLRRDKVTQQGVYPSIHQDFITAYSRWGFGPLELENPFQNHEGSVHIWQGYEDKIIPYEVNRYIADKLPWIRYHEVPDGGHLFMYERDFCVRLIRSLVAAPLS
ncbi:hypothetical protein MLD38_009546 [Melastoma candidum]|uniref:Uncharacterized protein n=1 Tax=Melastoma candidum TaxID=119954 RepID=A0ACB9RXK5_9MYRT|nr:hypothetical protein MLD38_009546 [Melastoma candidum]